MLVSEIACGLGGGGLNKSSGWTLNQILAGSQCTSVLALLNVVRLFSWAPGLGWFLPLGFSCGFLFRLFWTTIGSTSTSLRLYFNNILALLWHCYNSISVQLRLHFGPMFGTSLALHQLFVSCLVAQFGTNLIHHVSLYYSSC